MIAEFALDHPTEMALGTVAEVAQRAKRAAVGHRPLRARAGLRRVHRDAAGVPLAPRGQRGAELQGAHRRAEARGQSIRGRKSAAVLGRFVAEGMVFAGDPAGRRPTRELDARHRDAGRAEPSMCWGWAARFPWPRISTYVLRKLGRRVVLLDGLGGALGEQAAPPRPQDALIAISFRTYNPDTARLFPELVARKVPAVSITDSLLSPIVAGRHGGVRDPRHARGGAADTWWRRCAWRRAWPWVSTLAHD